MRVKDEHKDRVIGFNGSGLPLGQRNDLEVLAEIALKSNDKSLLDLFEKLPNIAEIEKSKSKDFLERTTEYENTTSTKQPKGNGK
jgi:hypothetical protein